MRVVAIGASAGGLEPVTALLSELPPKTGMAYVIVQHLAPSHESMLAEILSRATPMTVREVADGMTIEPDHVYVIPPNTNMTLEDGLFRLGPYTRVRGWHMPIDDFFQSLAERFRSRAIGVVLSGVASDGSLGCRAIKGEGGITFAQSEQTARFPEMPKAAIASGCVDFVHSPAEIARELARIGKAPLPAQSVAAVDGASRTAFPKIINALRIQTGVDFTQYRQTTLRRRIHRRMIVRKIATFGEYADLVRRDKTEVHSLYEDILITVTSFFRDAETFTLLKKKVFSALLDRKSRDAGLRVWVAGCSTGEEVYSIAISLFEYLEERAISVPLQIFATDISEKAIERARAGVFGVNIEANVSPERLRKFFTRSEKGYQISRPIRDVCVFARQNVGADPPFSNLDLISCRNLLIYLEPSLQMRVLPLFHYALRSDGFLLLGSAETVRDLGDLFEPQDRQHRLFRKKTMDVPRPLEFRGFPAHALPAAPGAGAPPFHAARGDASELQRRAERLLLTRYAPVGIVVDRAFAITSFRGQTDDYLQAPQGIATFNILKMAREGLAGPLRDAMAEARRTKLEVVRSGVTFRRPDGKLARVTLIVNLLHDDSRHVLVTFEPAARKSRLARAAGGREDARKVATVEQELSTTKDYLQSIIESQEATNEELTSANEEILSSNEELQSTNEELETAKEELQSTNEELRTVNDELNQRNTDLSFAHSDLSNVFASINLPMLIVGPTGNIRRFTPLVEKLLNVIPGDVGRPLADINMNIRIPNLAEIVHDVIANVEGYEREIQTRDGQWFLMRIRPYRTHDHKIDGAIILLLDIDPVKMGVDQINRARDYAETLVETVREGLLVLDGNLRVRTANRSFFAMFETSSIRVEGKPLLELPGWDDANLNAMIEGVLRRRESVIDFEWEYREDPEATPRALIVNARGLRLPSDPNPVALIAIQDVTERKRAEKELRESEGRYRRLFEKAGEGILLIDGESDRVIDANSFFTQMLGLTREHVVGKRLDEIAAFRHPGTASDAWDFERGNRIPLESEIPFLAASGAEVWANRVCSGYEADGKRMIQCNLRDVTAAKILQQQLWQSQKLESMGSLAGGIAHDFNNILGILSGYVGTIRRAEGSARKTSDALGQMEKAIDRGAGLIRQLLAFARRSDGETRERLDVNALVTELAEMLQETFPKSVRIDLDLAASLPPVDGDPNQLHQALLNLSVNARDAMPDGGALVFRTCQSSADEIRRRFSGAPDGPWVTVDVRDEGSGMDSETRRRMFEPFFTTKQEHGGSGLGLAVAYGIVKSHRGYISVESEPGNGTTFSIHLPVAPPAEDTPRSRRRSSATPAKKAASGSSEAVPLPEGQTAAAPATTKRSVLVVEDEPALLESMRLLIESEGYRVVTAADGREAVRLYAEASERIDVVVSDVQLPKLGGWETFRKIRETDPAAKVILASGLLDEGERRKWKNAGVRACVEKPFAAEELLKTLKHVIEN